VIVSAFLISYAPMRYVGADLATHRHLLSLGGTATVYTPGTERRYVRDGVLVMPYDLRSTDRPKPTDVFVTHAYGSDPLIQAQRRFEASVRILMLHSATGWVRDCFAAEADRYDLWIANSHATARALGIDGDDRCSVVHPELDPVFTAAAGPLRVGGSGGREDRPMVLMVNPIAPKGLEALRQLILRRPRWRYLVVPGGYGQQSTTGLVAAASRTGAQLQLLPDQVPPEHMARIYAKADVLVQPSDHESYGLTALEARTVGTPVVATDLPGVREALQGFPDGVAYIPAPATAEAMEGAVLSVLASSVPV
jgi:glycosyltransferase involved in cell wall biosynthesis